MKTTLLLAITAALSGCAATEFYGPDGKICARFQGNMTQVQYKRACNGAIKWTAATVNHSTPTIAGGNAFSKGTLAVGTGIATSGVTSLIK